MKLKQPPSSLLLLLLIIFTSCSTLFNPQKNTTPASSSNPLQFVAGTYNIHIGKGMDKQLDLKRIADVITANNAFVIGLQEVDRFTKRCGGVDQFIELKRLTGMNGIFGKSIDYDGGEFGLALLTKGEITDWHHQLMPVGEEKERRGFIAIEITMTHDVKFWVINTHFGLIANDRKQQVATILEFTKNIQTPIIFMGDLNEEDTTPYSICQKIELNFADSLQWLDTAQDISNRRGLTFPADTPTKRIDYIWLSKHETWTPLKTWVPQTQASDHRPVFTEIQLKK